MKKYLQKVPKFHYIPTYFIITDLGPEVCFNIHQ